MAEEHSLPGWPKKKLVKEVRRHLSHYGVRPTWPSLWRATWAWADRIAHSYFHVHWPLPSEIGTQYLLLLLAQIHDSRQLRLPYRAKDSLPPEVAALLPALQDQGFPPITAGTPRATKKLPKPPVDASQANLFKNLG